jgi:hypothetical protein
VSVTTAALAVSSLVATNLTYLGQRSDIRRALGITESWDQSGGSEPRIYPFVAAQEGSVTAGLVIGLR